MITLNYGSKEANIDSGRKIGLAAMGEERSVLLGDCTMSMYRDAHF